MYALNLNEENRILSACVVLANGNYEGMPIVDTLPDKSDLPEGITVENIDVNDFQLIDGKYVYNPLPKAEVVEQPTQLDIIEAQITYTAMMTGTLLESEGE